MALVSIISVLTLSACGGVNQSDPKSVAEAALKFKDANDYQALLTLTNPNDKSAVKQCEKMIEHIKTLDPKKVKESSKTRDYEFKGLKDGSTPEKKVATFSYYDPEYQGGFTFDVTVKLEQVEGKWYVTSIKG